MSVPVSLLDRPVSVLPESPLGRALSRAAAAGSGSAVGFNSYVAGAFNSYVAEGFNSYVAGSFNSYVGDAR